MDNGANGFITNSTVSGNAIHATASKGAGLATALAGGVYGEGDLSFLDATVARNLVARAGHTGTAGGGGLLSNGPPPKLEATILALNTAPPKGGPNCYGSVSSGGHNLLGTTSGCQFAHKTTDKLHRDPKLGSLADNGGATHTLALLSGSPAIDAIPKPACDVRTDQRGVRRPQGPRCDIGAYERKV